MNSLYLEDLRVTQLEEHHIPALITLFDQAVRRISSEHYSAEQLEQWALGAQQASFVNLLREHLGWIVLDRGERPLGFVTLSKEGHLSLLYVSADHQRRGLGSLLLTTALAAARTAGLASLTTEASALSYQLFVRHGFTLTNLESVERGGVSFTRYRLHRSLSS